MNSVADELRQENMKEVQLLSAEERIALALELGDFDLAIFCAQQNLEPAEAESVQPRIPIGQRSSYRQERVTISAMPMPRTNRKRCLDLMPTRPGQGQKLV